MAEGKKTTVENLQGPAQRRGRPTLELSMIVRDGALGLARCLDSVAGVVDRIVIGNTGSTDETASIAQHYNAEVVWVPWEDDFARAQRCTHQRTVRLDSNAGCGRDARL